MRSSILKPLEAKIKSLENEIISSEEKVKEMNAELSKPGLGAIRRSELSRELKTLLDNIDSCYIQLDVTMKEYDAEKLKYETERRIARANQAVRVGDHQVLCKASERARGSAGAGETVAAFGDVSRCTRPRGVASALRF